MLGLDMPLPPARKLEVSESDRKELVGLSRQRRGTREARQGRERRAVPRRLRLRQRRNGDSQALD